MYSRMNSSCLINTQVLWGKKSNVNLQVDSIWSCLLNVFRAMKASELAKNSGCFDWPLLQPVLVASMHMPLKKTPPNPLPMYTVLHPPKAFTTQNLQMSKKIGENSWKQTSEAWKCWWKLEDSSLHPSDKTEVLDPALTNWKGAKRSWPAFPKGSLRAVGIEKSSEFEC